MSRIITSLKNPRIKEAIKLRSGRGRQKQQRTIIDGVREALRAVEADVNLDEVFFCPELCQTGVDHALLERLSDAANNLLGVTPAVFDKLAYGGRSEGVVSLANTPRLTLEGLQLSDDSLIAVLEGVEKPGNVGAVARSADATGVAAMIVVDGGTDLYNPNAIRASLGAIFSMNICSAGGAETLDWLRRRETKIFAARVDGAVDYCEVDYRGSAIVLGSESQGLSGQWRGADVTPVKLPMLGRLDSLNVSATAAVLFYEALRQRRV